MEGKDNPTMERGFVAATHCDASMAKAYNNLGAVYGTGRVLDAVRAMNKALASVAAANPNPNPASLLPPHRRSSSSRIFRARPSGGSGSSTRLSRPGTSR